MYREFYENCHLCPRYCGVNRARGLLGTLLTTLNNFSNCVRGCGGRIGIDDFRLSIDYCISPQSAQKWDWGHYVVSLVML